jgi:hypothetical protein
VTLTEAARLRIVVAQSFTRGAFWQFNEIDFRNSRFGFNHDPVRFDMADRSVFVYLAVDRFEVVC